jgi:hypothetical protein
MHSCIIRKAQHVFTIVLVFENRFCFANLLFNSDPMEHTSTAVTQIGNIAAYQIISGIQDIGVYGRKGGSVSHVFALCIGNVYSTNLMRFMNRIIILAPCKPFRKPLKIIVDFYITHL